MKSIIKKKTINSIISSEIASLTISTGEQSQSTGVVIHPHSSPVSVLLQYTQFLSGQLVVPAVQAHGGF